MAGAHLTPDPLASGLSGSCSLAWFGEWEVGLGGGSTGDAAGPQEWGQVRSGRCHGRWLSLSGSCPPRAHSRVLSAGRSLFGQACCIWPGCPGVGPFSASKFGGDLCGPRQEPGPPLHTGHAPGHVGDTRASWRGCLPSLHSASAEMDGSAVSDVLMPRYTMGHLFGLNLENLHKIITRHFFPVVLDGIGGFRAQLPRLSSSESCINT